MALAGRLELRTPEEFNAATDRWIEQARGRFITLDQSARSSIPGIDPFWINTTAVTHVFRRRPGAALVP